MKFFKCHSQKMKNDKVICLQEKFTDIGPDVFDGFCVEYIILADTTHTIRNYAFSGIGKCNIYLPKSISEIEPLAFENINPNTVFYCAKGSYAEQICSEHGLTIKYDTAEIYRLVDEQKRLVEEQKQLVEDQKRLVEEQKRLVEEQKRILAEQQLKEKQEKLENEKIELAIKESEKLKNEENEIEEIEKYKYISKIISILKQVEALKAEDERKRKIKVYIFDDLKGERSDLLNYDDLPEGGKAQVKNEEIFIHCKYVDNKTNNSFISKEEYAILAKKPSVSKKLNTDSDENITVFIFDDADGEKKQVMKKTDFPQNAINKVVNGEVFIYRTLDGSKKTSTFISKNEFEEIKKNSHTEKDLSKTKAKNICPFCKKDLLEGDTFCPYCGRKVKNIKICNQCGEPNDKEDNFCSNCGSKI